MDPSQDDFCGKDTAHMAVALGNNHWSQRHYANEVIHPITGKEMEYSALMKDPRLQPLWTRGFGNECGRLIQGIPDIPGTDTHFFTTLKNIPQDRKITYGKIVCDYKIFKLKLQQAPSHVTQASPATIIQRPNLSPLPTQISTSHMPDKRQRRSQTTIHTPDTPDRPLPPRVVTPQTL
jgi:hypothetical protein